MLGAGAAGVFDVDTAGVLGGGRFGAVGGVLSAAAGVLGAVGGSRFGADSWRAL